MTTADELSELVKEAGYSLLSDFLFHAPDSHRYVSRYEEGDDIHEYVKSLKSADSVAPALISEDLGTAAKNADLNQKPIIISVINSSSSYAIVTESDVGSGFGQNTVPAWWAKET